MRSELLREALCPAGQRVYLRGELPDLCNHLLSLTCRQPHC